MGDFSGIDPAAMQKMIGSFAADASDLRTWSSNWKSSFDEHGLDTTSLSRLLGICGWLDDQQPMLKRRQGLAAAIAANDAPGIQMVHVPEPVTETSAQAQADGKKLAQEFNRNNGGDGKAGKQYHSLAEELKAHEDDPDFCSAFYANLTPSEATTLPSLLVSTRSSTASSDLEVYSRAFGTAASAAYPAPGFDQVKKAYLTPLPKGTSPAGWDRMAMLHYGTFPPDFTAGVTKAAVLDRLAKDPKQNLDGPASDSEALDLPQDSVTLALQRLSTSPEATRAAFGGMGQDGNKTDLPGNLKALTSYVNGKNDPDLRDAFKTDLTQGSGDRSTPGPYGSYDAPAPHTAAEADFAAAAMSALAQTKAHYSDYQDYISTTFTCYGKLPDGTSDQAGTQDAYLLHLATSADPKWPQTRPAIQSVATDAEQKKNDPAFMKSFYADGGGRFETDVASTLHAEDGTHDGTVLSAGSTKILADFGDNLAAATNLHAAGTLPEFDARQITAPQDMWSASMLVKYGPSGDKWDHTFLSSVSDAALRWGSNHQVMPTFQAASPNGVWSNWMEDPKDPWYGELGLYNTYPQMTFDQEMKNTQLIADNDPRLAILSKVADNPAASRDLLSGGDGKFAAGQLVNEQWQLPLGNGDNSQFPAKVIVAATQRGSGDKAIDTAATKAAANVFQAGLEDYKPDRDLMKDGTSTLPPKLGVALAVVAGAYVPDFADSTTSGSKSKKRGFVTFTNRDGQPEIETNPTAMNLLFHEFMDGNPQAAGSFKAAVHANMTNVVRVYHGDGPEAVDEPRAKAYLSTLGWLDGAVDNVTSDLQYKPAQKADEQANQEAMYTWIAGGMMSPFIAAPDNAKAAVSLIYKGVSMVNGGGSAWLSYQFSTGHAAGVEDATQKRDLEEDKYLTVPVINGLLASGQVKEKPTGYSWYHDGKVTLKSSDDWNQFDMWTKSTLTDQQLSLLRNLTFDSSAGYDDGTIGRTPSTAAVE